VKAAEDYAREAIDAAYGRPFGALDSAAPALAALFRAAQAEAVAALLAPAAGGEVTPEEVRLIEDGGPVTGTCLPCRMYRERDVERLCGEVRRLWAVLGDVARDSEMYRHGFAAGWRACRDAAADGLARDAEAYVPVIGSPYHTLREAAARVRALEPPDLGGS
jgi:hypothetical protein